MEPEAAFSPKPPIVYAGGLLLGFAAAFVVDASFAADSTLRLGSGLALIAFGVALVGVCELAYRNRGEDMNPDVATSQLVSSGPFQRSRNPVYLGMTAIHLGIGIAADNGFIVVSGIAVHIWIAWIVVPAEERYLNAKLGEEYADYCARVRRWL